MSVSCFFSLSNTWGAYHRFNMDCERLLLQKASCSNNRIKKYSWNIQWSSKLTIQQQNNGYRSKFSKENILKKQIISHVCQMHCSMIVCHNNQYESLWCPFRSPRELLKWIETSLFTIHVIIKKWQCLRTIAEYRYPLFRSRFSNFV